MISSYSLKVVDTVVSSVFVCASDHAHAQMSLDALKKFCHRPLQKVHVYICNRHLRFYLPHVESSMHANQLSCSACYIVTCINDSFTARGMLFVSICVPSQLLKVQRSPGESFRTCRSYFIPTKMYLK